LKHADPSEIADELSNLFPSNNSGSDQNNRSMGFQFDGPPFMQQQASGNSNPSARMQRQSTVLAVADRRTQAVIVTASKELMEEIKGMIEDLDDGSMGVQKVYALSLDSADPASVQETMAGLFAGTGASSKSQSTTQSALSARESANANSQSSSSSSVSFGSSGSGTSSMH
jgi:type II secretory pathway component GspD/PulD (secretin)